MIDMFSATLNVATRIDATPAGLRPISGSGSSGSADHSGAPAPQDGGRAARLAYRLVAAIGGIGR